MNLIKNSLYTSTNLSHSITISCISVCCGS